MEKEIKIKDKTYFFIEVPFDAYGFSNNLHSAQIDFLQDIHYKYSSLMVSDTVILKDYYDSKFNFLSVELLLNFEKYIFKSLNI